MKTYDPEDIATFYFVIKREGDGSKTVRAWTDDKDLLNAYMELHHCKKYTVKKLRKTMRDIYDIINENIHDEIDIVNVITRGKDGPGLISIPMTTTEVTFIQDESKSFYSMQIDYRLLDEMLPYLKDRYNRAMNGIGIQDIIHHVVYNSPSPFVQDVLLDQAILFVRSFPDEFGV